MDRRELLDNESETLRIAFEGLMTGIWTAMPGIIQSFDGNLAVIQVAHQALIRDPQGQQTYVTLPPLLDCPVVFPSGGGFVLTMPVSKGDEVLVVFASRCIDGWWQSGGAQIAPDLRMHDLSDGFFVPGVFSNGNKVGNVSTNSAQLRSKDGLTFVEVAGGGVVNVTAPTQINLNSPIVQIAGIINVQNENSVSEPCNINGAITATGEITSTLGGTHTLTQHDHGNVTNGGGTTAKPTG